MKIISPKLNKFIFYPSSILIVLLSVYTILYPTLSSQYLDLARCFLGKYFSWYYMLLMSCCIFVSGWLVFTKYGDIKLGKPNEEPEYSYMSWLFMLFSSGIGIAIVYYGCYEPVEHFYHPPVEQALTPHAAQSSMVLTYLHWGFHGWSLYAITAVIIGYFAYVKDYNLEIRSPLYNLFGTKLINGWLGNLIDGFGILATTLAMVTNLGIGALVINAGLHFIFGIDSTVTNLTVLCIIMTIMAAIIAIIGIEHGIAFVSTINIYALCCLLLYVFIDGYTVHTLDALIQNTGDYINNFWHLSFNMYIYQNAELWRASWTIFYWAWWVTWTPFVGMFLAKISKGRTMRELILSTLFVPAIFTLLWLGIFGNNTLYMIIKLGYKDLATEILNHPELSIYKYISYLDFSKILLIVTTVISFILFFAPVDSGCIVISELSVIPPHRAGDPQVSTDTIESPLWLRVFWCIIPCLVTIGLFYTGNFMAIQTAVVLFALPFSFVIFAYIISFIKDIKKNYSTRCKDAK